MQFESAISTNNGKLDFGSSEPCQKSWLTKKVVPAIKKIVPAVQKVGVIAGKVATVAALL